MPRSTLRLLVLLGLGLLTGGCSGAPEPERSEEPAPPTPSLEGPRQEFERLAEELRRSPNPYFGELVADELEKAVAATAAGSAERVEKLLELSHELLRLGRT